MRPKMGSLRNWIKQSLGRLIREKNNYIYLCICTYIYKREKEIIKKKNIYQVEQVTSVNILHIVKG